MKSNVWTKCLLVLFVIGICFSAVPDASAGKTVVVAMDGDWPPMKMKDDKGNITGYEMDMINAISAAAGFQVTIVEEPWDTLFAGLDAGRYDAVIASVSITEGRKKKFDFSAPYFSAEQLLVIPKSLVGKPLEGKTIAAFEATTGGAALKRSWPGEKKFYPVARLERPFKDLAEGKVSGVICDTPVAVHFVFLNESFKRKFAIESEDAIFPAPSPKEQYGIVVKKGNSAVLDLMNKGIASVKARRIDAKLRAKWLKW